jgi:hypothetical protein
VGKFVGKNSGIAAILGFGIYEPKYAPDPSNVSLTKVAKKHGISRASVCRLMKEASGNSHLPILIGGASIRDKAHV